MPRQLPGPPVHFANRRSELSALDVKLRGRGRTPGIAVLKGPAGVGKSAVALRWLDSARDRFPDGQLYARLALPTGDPVAVEDVLGEFLRALGVMPERVPPGFSERVTLFRSMTADRSLAVLLDDALSAAQVKALLPASPTSVVVVTSRYPLAALLTDGAQVVSVEPLDDGSATELLARHIGVERLATEREPVEALVGLCAGLPIALCVAAAQLALRPHRPIAKLVAELRDERRRLDVLSMGDLSVRSTLDLSVRALAADAVAVYVSIGVHPGRLVCPELIVATNRFGPGRARRALDELVDASLLQEIDDELYQCHDLVRAHARAEASTRLDVDGWNDVVRATLEWHLYVARETGAVVMPARRRVPVELSAPVRYELPPDIGALEDALGWLDRHRLDLAALVPFAVDAELHELAYALGDALQPLFIVHRHHREAAEVAEHALSAALAMGDSRAQANMRKRLARVLVDLGELPLARRHIDELIETSERLGDRRGRASGLKSLARLHARLGRHEAAAAAYAEVACVLREIGHRRGEGLALTELGAALIDAGRHAEAVPPLVQARAILLTVEPPDQYNAARATVPLALARVRLGDHQIVRDLLEEAGEQLATLGADHQLGRMHETLAELHEATGDAGQAREHRNRAGRLYTRAAGPAAGSGVDRLV